MSPLAWVLASAGVVVWVYLGFVAWRWDRYESPGQDLLIECLFLWFIVFLAASKRPRCPWLAWEPKPPKPTPLERRQAAEARSIALEREAGLEFDGIFLMPGVRRCRTFAMGAKRKVRWAMIDPALIHRAQQVLHKLQPLSEVSASQASAMGHGHPGSSMPAGLGFSAAGNVIRVRSTLENYGAWLHRAQANDSETEFRAGIAWGERQYERISHGPVGMFPSPQPCGRHGLSRITRVCQRRRSRWRSAGR